MGPNCVTNYSEMKALIILLRYLTSTSVSPLQRDMIEIVDPYGSQVYFGVDQFLETLLYFKFENSPIKKIEEILTKFKEVLGKVSNEEKIDMQRMRSIIDKKYLEDLSALENIPHSALSNILRKDNLYGSKEAHVSIECLSN